MDAYAIEGLAQALFEEAGDALFLFDPGTEKLIDANPMAERLSGFPRAEIPGLLATYLFHSESKGGMARLREASRKTGIFHSQDGYLLRTRQDGAWVPVSLSLARLHVPPTALGLITARDVRQQREAHASLAKVEAELKRVLSSVSDCLWSAAMTSAGQWDYRYISPVVERITGHPPDFFQPGVNRWWSILHPADRPCWERMLLRLRAGQSTQEEYRIVWPDETVRWVRDSVLVRHDRGGQSWVLDGVLTDVTERKRTEEALRESQGRFQAFMDNSPAVAFIKDGEGRYVYVNRQHDRLHQRDFVGKTDVDLWPAEAAGQLRKHDQEVLSAGKALEATETVPGPDGSPHDWLVFKFPVPDTSGRQFVGGMAVDITERRRAEEALREQRDFAESLIETAEAIVLVLDTTGRIVRFNRYMEELSGYRLGEVQGQDWFTALLPERDRQRTRDAFTQTLARGASSGTVSPILARDGREREIKWSAKALKGAAGNAVGVLAIGQDITDLKEAQQRALQSERLAAIGQMVAGLAHESRNALQRGQACLEMLALALKGQPKALDHVTGIQHAQDDLHRIYEEVTGYASPILLERQKCHLGEILNEAWARLAPLRKGRLARLREVGGPLDLHCEVDRFRLGQVFRNVLENALGACVDPVNIAVSWSGGELAGRPVVHVAVRDNGPGLGPEQQRRIFEPFYTTKIHGIGLGMAIVKRIVEAHGGQIAIASGKGRGAEVRITLPREAS